MSHRAALYQVQVRPLRRKDSWQLLGDYDRAGTWLGNTLQTVLTTVNFATPEGASRTQFESVLPKLESDEVGISIVSGHSGVRSVLNRSGDPPFPRSPEHFEDLRSAVLFRLPRSANVGHMVVHVPHTRSAKTVIETILRGYMSSRGFVLRIAPVVSQEALRQAVEQDAVERITLIKHDPTHSDKFRASAQWGSDRVARLELSIPSRRYRRLNRDPLKRFLDDGTDVNRRGIVEFEGLVFDEVAVTVEMPDGAIRTFYLEPREGGHPITVGLNLSDSDQLGAKPEDLTLELRNGLPPVSPPA